MPCSNAAKTQNPLKFVRVSQTPETISAVSGPKFTILSGHVEEVLLLNKFFPIVDTCLTCKDIAGQSCAMVPSRPIFGDFFGAAFPASRVQQISDLHSKFALGPRHVWKYGYIQSPTAEIRRGKKRKKEEERRKKQDENIMVCPVT